MVGPVAEGDLVRMGLVTVDGDDAVAPHLPAAPAGDLGHADRQLRLHLAEERCCVRMHEREGGDLHEGRAVPGRRPAVRARDLPLGRRPKVEALPFDGLPLRVRLAAAAAACKDDRSQKKRLFASGRPG